MSYLDITAKSAAIIATFAKYPSEEQDKISRHELYDMIMSLDNEADIDQWLRMTGAITFKHCEFETAADIQHWLTAYHDSIKEHIISYTHAIHGAIVIQAMNLSLPANASLWEIHDMATFGYNIMSTWNYHNQKLIFNPTTLQWESQTSSLTLPFDPATGLPVPVTQTLDRAC